VLRKRDGGDGAGIERRLGVGETEKGVEQSCEGLTIRADGEVPVELEGAGYFGRRAGRTRQATGAIRTIVLIEISHVAEKVVEAEIASRDDVGVVLQHDIGLLGRGLGCHKERQGRDHQSQSKPAEMGGYPARHPVVHPVCC